VGLTKRVKWLAFGRKTAMNRRKWDPRTKVMIVMEGLKGKPIAEICIEHQINQAPSLL
jgi:transposase-like protein